MPTFQDRIESAYPYESYANTLRALSEGIAAADDTIKGIPMFASEVGEDYRGLIRRAGSSTASLRCAEPAIYRSDAKSPRCLAAHGIGSTYTAGILTATS
jgi:hypothetical protein